MSAHIGRKQAIGIGKEITAGTKVSASIWLAKTSGVMQPMIETLQDTQGYWVIDEVYDVQPIKEHTELSVEGTISDLSFWFILLSALGTAGVSGSGPYTHAFTRNNTNSHQSFTVWWYDPVATWSSAFAMLNSLEISAVAGEYATFKMDMIGKKTVTESTPSVSYASENLFRARDCKVYIADTEAGLASATAIPINSITLKIEKNLYVHQNIGTLDIDSIYNQQLNVSGEFEGLFTAKTYQDFVRNGTKKYMKIELINTDVTLTPSGNPTISITLAKVWFESWEQGSDNNDIIKETVWFIGAFNNTDGYTIKASMINSRSTVY